MDTTERKWFIGRTGLHLRTMFKESEQEKYRKSLRALIGAFDDVSDNLAEAQFKYYENLQEEGFSEEQAFEIMKEMGVRK